jgi:hypothetical protein
MNWEAYARLSAGRVSHKEVDVAVAGDTDLAHRVLAAMAITP